MLFDLDWLKRPPTDFRSRLRMLRANESNMDRELQALAGYASDFSQLGHLAKLADECRTSQLPLVKLGILGGGTQDLTAPAIAGTALRYGLRVRTIIADYGASVVGASAKFGDKEAADIVLFAPDYRSLGLDIARVGEAEARDAVELRGLRSKLRLLHWPK